MSLVNLYIIPHGDELIDLPDKESVTMRNYIAEIAGNDDSDVIVILSPHGMTIKDHMAVINTEYFRAETKLVNKKLDFLCSNERKLTEEIIEKFPEFCLDVRFSTYSGELSVFPLDFGSSIPLYFFNQRKIVMIGQPRINDRAKLVDFGKSLFHIVKNYPKKVSIILSADQAHTHSAKGPYGYSEDADKYEKILVNAIKNNSLDPLYTIDQETVNRGKPDSFWNMLILKGIMDESGIKIIIDYHYVAVYFGMLLAHSVTEK